VDGILYFEAADEVAKAIAVGDVTGPVERRTHDQALSAGESLADLGHCANQDVLPPSPGDVSDNGDAGLAGIDSKSLAKGQAVTRPCRLGNRRIDDLHRVADTVELSGRAFRAGHDGVGPGHGATDENSRHSPLLTRRKTFGVEQHGTVNESRHSLAASGTHGRRQHYRADDHEVGPGLAKMPAKSATLGAEPGKVPGHAVGTIRKGQGTVGKLVDRAEAFELAGGQTVAGDEKFEIRFVSQ
jgi:hypothetical protein